MTESKDDRLQDVGRNALASIREMVAALECDYDRLQELRDEREAITDGESKARERIQEDALSVRVFGERINGEWTADRFEILLTTGGPAVRIMAELDGDEPCRAWLEVQDWGTPWAEHYETDMADLCLSYAGCFYFGE